ncbi:MAG: LysR family transcriptional regulator [Geminicoccaceae bacterium]
MEIETLRLFVDVANRLSFAAVAADRGVNPSSVSRAIAHLEGALGVRLLQRSTRRMTLTESGQAFRARVTDILDEYDQAVDQAQSSARGAAGTLRLTASVAFGERVITPLVPAFRATYPAVKLELLFTDANLDLVSNGIDLAVRLGHGVEGDLIASKLIPTRYRVCASPAYLADAAPINAPADLEHHPCVLFTLPAYRTAWRFRSRGDGAAETVVPVSGDIAVSSALSLRSAVLSGLGPGLLADWLVGDDIEAGRLTRLLPDFEVTATEFDTAAWLVYPSRAYLPSKVRVMIDFLRAQLRPFSPSLS